MPSHSPLPFQAFLDVAVEVKNGRKSNAELLAAFQEIVLSSYSQLSLQPPPSLTHLALIYCVSVVCGQATSGTLVSFICGHCVEVLLARLPHALPDPEASSELRAVMQYVLSTIRLIVYSFLLECVSCASLCAALLRCFDKLHSSGVSPDYGVAASRTVCFLGSRPSVRGIVLSAFLRVCLFVVELSLTLKCMCGDVAGDSGSAGSGQRDAREHSQ